MKLQSKISIVTLAMTILVPLWSSAKADLNQCSDLVKECFAYGDTERSNCFFTAANHPYCANSPLADLVVKRWSLAPASAAPQESYAALVGPELVDRECLKNFDSGMSGKLVNGPLTVEAIKTLTAQLDACSASQNIDISRP